MKIIVDDYKNINDLDDTNAINKAISIANKGDIIIFNSRLYISGTIKLKSNINIVFNNSHLKASNNLSDFSDGVIFDEKLDINTFINCDYNGMPKLFFIYGKNLENVNISGNGIIDGNEEIFYGEINDNYIEGAFYPRMPLFYIEGCKNINIKDVTLTKSAFWTLHLIGCDGVNINNIKILNNRRMLNADGIDPDHSKNIIIENSYIESADDCIAIKNTEYFKDYGDSHNIIVRNCTFLSSSAALKIGTETCGDFYDIHFENIKILDSNRAVSLQLRDFGNIYDIHFDNISMETHMFYPKCFWGKGEAISITNVKRNNNTKLGKIYNIEFNDICAKSEHGIFMYGDIDNVIYKNINIECINNSIYDKTLYDLRPTEDIKLLNIEPKVIVSRYAKNIKINNIKHNDLYELLDIDDKKNICFE